jgi:hypothetical protein
LWQAKLSHVTSIGMGTWGSGPFDNDAAADFLGALQASPSRTLIKTLSVIAGLPPGKYIDVDDGGAAWAACELVALAFGYGDTEPLADSILDLIGKLRPKDEHRLLALQVLSRIADSTNSELAGLWHEADDGPKFDAAIEQLRSRLQAASQGPREQPRPKTGDVIALRTASESAELVVVQVVGSREIAVFEGICASEKDALDRVKSQPGRRVPAQVNKLMRRGRLLGNIPLRKDLKGKKYYAREGGLLDGYYLSTASGAGFQQVTYEEARNYDEDRQHDDDAIRAVALGRQPVTRVRSVDEREAELYRWRGEKWAARREITTPGPFGDIRHLERWLQWVEECSLDNWVDVSHQISVGRLGYGRPKEDAERRDYAFAGLVALWRGTWPRELWPSELSSRLPLPPEDTRMLQALNAARILADRVLTRDAELRLIWDAGSDKGAELRRWVSSLQQALAEANI